MNWKNLKKYNSGLFILPLVFGAGITLMAKYSAKLTNSPPVGAAFGTATSTIGGLSWLTSVALGLLVVLVVFFLVLYFQKHH
tara:strand:- start:156 stop:401 length:246 start_codon:yes stop_codon:yes gene_type:complete